MKQIIVLMMLMTMSVASFSQQTTHSQVLTKEDYFLKSKHQKTIAIIMLAGGGSLVLTMPLAWYANNKNENGLNIFSSLFVVGLVAIPASIPFFIASSRNKKKAIRLAFKSENFPQLFNGGFRNTPLPALSLKMSL